MRYHRPLFVALLVTTTPTILLPAPSFAQSTGLEDMVGARAGQAEGELGRRGYRNVGGEKGDDRSYTFWWNASRRQCVTIATMNGRYDSITPSPAPDCRQPANTRPRPDYNYPPQPPYPVQGDRDPGYPRPVYPPAGDRPSTLPSNGPVVAGRPVELGLVCFGDGSRNGLANRPNWQWNPRKDRYDYGYGVEGTTEVFDASLMIQTWAGGGRIRLPRALIPPINSRGSNGWWELYDVSVGPDVIRATYRLNGLNKPRVLIDRRSGRITVQGTADYGFRGTCDVIGNQARRF